VKDKAISSYHAACQLANSGRFNDAANRAYYALYQALVFAWEDQGFNPEDVDGIARNDKNTGDDPRWRHAFLRKNLSKIKLTTEQEKIMDTAWRLRVKADYMPDNVRGEIKAVLEKIPALLFAIRKITV
jgi:hypothetical protein